HCSPLGWTLGGTTVWPPVLRSSTSRRGMSDLPGEGSSNVSAARDGGLSTRYHQCERGAEARPEIMGVGGSSTGAARIASGQSRSTSISPCEGPPVSMPMLASGANIASTSASRTRSCCQAPVVGFFDLAATGIGAYPFARYLRAAERTGSGGPFAGEVTRHL